jgi:hypothetical protein
MPGHGVGLGVAAWLGTTLSLTGHTTLFTRMVLVTTALSVLLSVSSGIHSEARCGLCVVASP